MHFSENTDAERNTVFKKIAFFMAGCFLFLEFHSYCFASPINPTHLLIPLTEQQNASSADLIDLSSRKGAKAFLEINDEFRKQNYEKIKQYAKDQIAINPEIGLAHEVFGAALFMLGQEEEAIEALKKAAVLEPKQSGPNTKLGIILMNNGQIDQAQSYLERAVKLNPVDRFAHQHLGLLFEYKKDNARAIKHFQKGLEGTDPFYLGVSVNLARLFNQEKLYSQVIDLLAPRLPISSENSDAHIILASAYYRTEQFDPSKARFERILELTPQLPEAELGVAMCLRSLGNPEAALSRIEKLTEEKPEWLPALMEYGETLLILNHLEKAKKVFDKCVLLGSEPQVVEKRIARYHLDRKEFDEAEKIYKALIDSGIADKDVYAKTSELLQAKGRHEEGVLMLEKGLQKYPKDAYLLFRLGTYLASMKRYDDAVKQLRLALDASPNDPMVLSFLSIAQTKAGDQKGALQSAARLYELQPKNNNAAILYAARLQANGKLNKAEDIYRKVLASDPENQIALNNLAELLAGSNNLHEAEVLATKLNKVSEGKNGIFLDTLGWIMYRQNRFVDAKNILQTAIKINPDIAVIHFHLGMVLDQIGDKENARQVLAHAISIDSNASWVAEAQKKLKGKE